MKKSAHVHGLQVWMTLLLFGAAALGGCVQPPKDTSGSTTTADTLGEDAQTADADDADSGGTVGQDAKADAGPDTADASDTADTADTPDVPTAGDADTATDTAPDVAEDSADAADDTAIAPDADDAGADAAPDTASDAADDTAAPEDVVAPDDVVTTDVGPDDVELTDVPEIDAVDDALADVDLADVGDDALADAGADADDAADATDPFAQCIPCDAANPCAIGACAANALGACCVPTCTDTCKTGASCLTLPDNPGIKACVPDHITLCRPCQQSTDCQESGFQPGAVCHALAPDVGSFCATPCSATTTCPVGYACQGVPEDTSGATFCVPESQICTCDDLSKAKQLTTSCSATNAFGTCSGTRTCDAAGLTACNAPSAAAEICDGLDNDCDGLTDEDIAPIPTTCGKGACAETGSKICVAGGVVDTCTEGVAASTDTSCNNIDDNCDGQTDEGFVKLASVCGAGACSSSGLKYCEGGTVKDSCVTSDPTTNDDNCNGIDDNCDGKTDEGYPSVITTCGIGACAATGKTKCVGGLITDSCKELPPALADTTCDGVDDDCNGLTDDAYAPTVTACGLGACVAAGETSCKAGKVEDSCKAGTPAPADLTCDGIDEDCNGLTDDGYLPQLTGCGIGACTSLGVTSCALGQIKDSCEAGIPATGDTNCNSIDDDCNGLTDDGYGKTPTTCGTGACAATGLRTCEGGVVKDSCAAGTPGTTDTTCDGVDEDCNGLTDDGYQKTPTNCGIGACAATGLQYCEDATVKDSCATGSQANNDFSCNGIDDDCNGLTDDGYPPAVTTCGIGACAAVGLRTCVAGQVHDSCTATLPAPTDTTCDGIDDNCNNETDEGYAPLNTSCGIGACKATGKTKCTAGLVTDSCAAGAPAVADETCDGVDDDCDTMTDEDYGPQITKCGIGACTSLGVTSCVAAHIQDSCKAGKPADSDTTCNNVDDDCNAETDEDYESLATSCGIGGCGATGVTTCAAGGVVEDSCTPSGPALDDANCNNIDDDCNGLTDEGFKKQATACGIGACVAFGQTSCAAGQIKNSCVALTPTGNDANCNGKDDDCNGQTDDLYPPVAITCGKGVCVANGTTICEQGIVVDQCSEGPKTSGDTECNGLDDDCDGLTDESYVGTTTTCGIGACVSTGLTTCTAGVTGDSCTPGVGALSDTTCDGIDDDCDTQTDEDFAQIASTCGIGACASTGHKYCEGAIVKDTCTTKAPAATDKTCDGIDDNCNNQTDEGYGVVPSTCGQGLCAATGSKTCAPGGQVIDSCAPGTPTSDVNCDGKDNNCNGLTDEGYVSQPTTCGQGECATTGTRTCVGGSLSDSCAPLTPPESPEVSCDNKDNDCDGKTDAADPDMPVMTCCAGNAGQFNVDTSRACPAGWFCDQSWDSLNGKSSKYERMCYYGGSGSGSTDGECSPYDCGKATSTFSQDGAFLTYDWCTLFKSYTILGVSADDINAICGWSTNGILTSNAARSGNGSTGNAEEFSGFWCSCNPMCETIYGSSSHKCCKNLFASGANSAASTNGSFKCGKSHVNLSTLPTFQDPHFAGSRCRHNVECLGGMKCSTPGTFAADGTPIPTKAPTPAGTCS